MKYDVGGRGENDYYRGLGWNAKYNWARDPDAPLVQHVPLSEKEAIREAKARGEVLAPQVVFRRRATMWPTPVKHEDRAAAYSLKTSRRHFLDASHQVHLAQAVRDPVLQPVRKFPTPTAQDADPKRSKAPPPRVRFTSTGLPEADRPSGSGAQIGLMQAAVVADRARAFYPTPIKSDAAVSKNLVTLQKVENGEAFNQLSRAIRTAQMKEAGEWESNPDAVRGEGEATVGRRARAKLPTPTATNGLRNGGGGGATDGTEHYPMMWQSPGHPEYGELNPRWEEWIMGWPIGWTSLDPMDPAAFEEWWDLISADPETGMPRMWLSDPSDDPESGLEKTCRPASAEAEEQRQQEVGCLGNGQVSAVVAGVVTLLAGISVPHREGD